MKRFWEKVENGPGCWLWIASRDANGYGLFSLRGRLIRAHRVAWILENGGIPSGVQVLHRCDNPQCVRVSHLFLGTNHDNVLDRHSKNRSKNLFKNGHLVNAGEKSRTAKLTWGDVREIRRLAATGESIRGISRKFCIDESGISRVVSGKSWKE